jgi:hypothetical protein
MIRIWEEKEIREKFGLRENNTNFKIFECQTVLPADWHETKFFLTPKEDTPCISSKPNFHYQVNRTLQWALFEESACKISMFRLCELDALKSRPICCTEVHVIVYQPNSLKSQKSEGLVKFCSSSYASHFKIHFNIIPKFTCVSWTVVSLQVFSLPYSFTSHSSAVYEISGPSHAFNITLHQNPNT